MQPQYYVITSRSMGGEAKDATAVFRDREDCERCQTKNGGGGEIEPRVVIGEITNPDEVYIASEYHSGPDLLWFLGLYGNFELAIQAVGEHGEVRSSQLR